MSELRGNLMWVLGARDTSDMRPMECPDLSMQGLSSPMAVSSKAVSIFLRNHNDNQMRK